MLNLMFPGTKSLGCVPLLRDIVQVNAIGKDGATPLYAEKTETEVTVVRVRQTDYDGVLGKSLEVTWELEKIFKW